MTRAAILLLLAACIWDSDTLDDELHGIPDGMTLVTGRWHRHGRAYYEARLKSLPDHIKADPTDLDAYDDLAVAHERLRNRDAAIEVMRAKAGVLKEHPDPEHQYRYHANLGTFYAHSGRFDEAVRELEAAVALNPEAHFGRERFQIDAIRYVAACKKDPTLWTRHNFLSWSDYVLEDGRSPLGGELSYDDRALPRVVPEKARRVRWNDAYTAVAGMLRFGGLEGAELYRTLGDLFHQHEDLHLAWWSYRHAVEKDHPAKERIVQAIRGIEKHWKGTELGSVPTEEEFLAVSASSGKWLKAYQDAEVEALNRGEKPSEPGVLEKLLARADEEAGPVPGFGGRTGMVNFFSSTKGKLLLVFSIAPILSIAALILKRRTARGG